MLPFLLESGLLVCYPPAHVANHIECLENSIDFANMILTAAHDATDGFLITDPKQDDNPIIFVSRSFLRLTGYKEDEVLGRNCRFLQGTDTEQTPVQQIHSDIAACKESKAVILNYRKDGTPFWNLIRITPIFNDDNELDFFVGVQTDITGIRLARRRYHEQQNEIAHLSRVQHITEMSVGIFHQLKQPMAAIKNYLYGCLTLLKNNSPIEKIESGLSKAANQIDAADNIIQYFLMYIKKQTLNSQPEDINTIIKEALQFIEYAGIGLDVDIQVSLSRQPIIVRADKIQLIQILVNIVKNAFDAFSEEQINKEVEIKVQQKNERVYVTIANNGEHIPPASLQRLFTPFFSTKAEGHGIGLALVQRIITRHGGKISARSEQGGQTVFTINLPCLQDDVTAPN